MAVKGCSTTCRTPVALAVFLFHIFKFSSLKNNNDKRFQAFTIPNPLSFLLNVDDAEDRQPLAGSPINSLSWQSHKFPDMLPNLLMFPSQHSLRTLGKKVNSTVKVNRLKQKFLGPILTEALVCQTPLLMNEQVERRPCKKTNIQQFLS